MKAASLVCLILALTACGGSKNNGTPTNPTPTATRIIHIDGDLSFGTIAVGSSFEIGIRIHNSGTDTLTVTGMTVPSGGVYSATWTSGTIAPDSFQAVGIRFTPVAAQSYNGTLTVNANHTSGTNTRPISGTGQRDLFRRSGTGDFVFDMPFDVSRVRIIGTFNGNSSNFIVRIGGRLIVNELLGTGWNQVRYEGVLLTGGGGVVAITNSSGVAWSFEEVR